jgi:hypothetical protein
MYIRRIANHLHAEKGMTISHAIAVAVNAVKKMCGTGDLNWSGKQNVNAGSRAEACAAVSSWEAKKAGARVSKGVLGRKWSDEEFIDFIMENGGADEIHKSAEGGKCHVCEFRNRRDAAKKKKKVSKVKAPAKRAPRAPAKNCKKVTITDEEFSELEEEINADAASADGVAREEFEVTGDIEKRDDEKQLVFGWASIAKHKDGTVEVDKQGDVLEDIDQMEKVAYDFVLHSRDGGEMHVRKGVSTLVESFVSTPEKWEAMEIPEGVLPTGWWVGFHVHDTEVWKGVKEGKYKMFSVHGSGVRKELGE